MKKILNIMKLSLFALIIYFGSSKAESQFVRFLAEEYRIKDTIKTLDSIQVSYYDYDVQRNITFKNSTGALNLPFIVDFSSPTSIDNEKEFHVVDLTYNNGQLLISTNQSFNTLSITIYNYMGQIVKSHSFKSPITEQTISFSDYPEGIYFAAISYDGQTKRYNFQKITSEQVFFNLLSKPQFSDFQFIAFKDGWKSDTIYKDNIIGYDYVNQ